MTKPPITGTRLRVLELRKQIAQVDDRVPGALKKYDELYRLLEVAEEEDRQKAIRSKKA